MRERDLLTFVVLPSSAEEDGKPSGLEPALLRRRYGVRAGDFRVLLIGKDGGVKREARAPVSLESLFGQIDAMPMRRKEAGSGF